MAAAKSQLEKTKPNQAREHTLPSKPYNQLDCGQFGLLDPLAILQSIAAQSMRCADREAGPEAFPAERRQRNGALKCVLG
jgi:hypothetical protein